MLKYVSIEGKPAPFVPFDMLQPTYEEMSTKQEAWYFYWRSQVRQDNYIDTDLSYILLYTYEIINGVGWRVPQEGYECLLRIRRKYQNKYLYLDYYLPDWIFDFAQLHGIKHTQSLEGRSIEFIPHPKLNLLIEQYAEDVPLKIPFKLIERLCTHSFQKSEFYNDGNEALMQEAIPMVLALADAMLRKKTNVGFLQTYGPVNPKKLRYNIFKEARCLKSNKSITIAVKTYTVHAVLIYQITELARYTENTLRELKGYRDRLKGVSIDQETAKLITLFLKCKYGEVRSENKEFDFDDIEAFLDSQNKKSAEEKDKQIISPQTAATYELMHISFLRNYSEDTFFIDMFNYAPFEGKKAQFVSCNIPRPTYKDMNRQQQAWYFYWRTQARQDNYLDTDLSYILLYIYEIINGVGWRVPQEGYECLLRIRRKYQNKYLYLDYFLPNWIFDFAQLHGIKHTLSLEGKPICFISHTKVDILIEQYAECVPLKLPFALIEILSNLSYEKNMFYNENKALMHEAIPRVLALQDALLRKKTNFGFLQTYGPEYSFEQEYYTFEDAYCLKSNRILSITVKAYTVHARLTGHIAGLVRYAENTLREIKKYRSRLQGGRVNADTAKMVKAFLKQEYGEKSAKIPREKVEITLNFEDIATLREQSDAVRAALEVENAIPVENEEQSPFLKTKTVTTLFDESKLSNELKELMECLTPPQQEALHTLLTTEHPEHELEKIAEHSMTMPQILLDEINELALRILDDVLIESDQEPRILDEYIPHLKQAIR